MYNRECGTIWGADNEFMSAPRLDDVMCAFSCIKALTDNKENIIKKYDITTIDKPSIEDIMLLYVKGEK